MITRIRDGDRVGGFPDFIGIQNSWNNFANNYVYFDNFILLLFYFFVYRYLEVQGIALVPDSQHFTQMVWRDSTEMGASRCWLPANNKVNRNCGPFRTVSTLNIQGSDENELDCGADNEIPTPQQRKTIFL